MQGMKWKERTQQMLRAVSLTEKKEQKIQNSKIKHET